jgi:hypothetical protein
MTKMMIRIYDKRFWQQNYFEHLSLTESCCLYVMMMMMLLHYNLLVGNEIHQSFYKNKRNESKRKKKKLFTLCLKGKKKKKHYDNIEKIQISDTHLFLRINFFTQDLMKRLIIAD